MARERGTGASGSGRRAVARAEGVWRFRTPPALSAPARYAVGLAASLLAAAVQYSLLPQPAIAPFVFFYFTVALASWLAGLGPGLLAVVLSALLANYLFVTPHREWALTSPALTATGLFVVSAGAVSLLCASFRRAALETHRVAAALRAQAEELTRTTEELHSLAEGMPQLVFTTDAAGNPDYFNGRWREYTGEAPGPEGSYRRFFHPEDLSGLVGAWDEAVRSRTSFQHEYRIRGGDGRYRWFLGRGWPMRDPEGNVLRWLGTATDIDDLKHAQAELREADRRKNEFLAMLSHELRNPLAPIRTSVYILARSPPGAETARRAQFVIDRQVQHLTRLVDDLLDVTRISRGKIRLQREPVELAALVRRAADDHREFFSTNGVELDVLVGDAPVHVNGDATRLAQVVGNLLQNAAKFTPRGGRTTIVLETAEAFAAIAVRDTGAGISPETMAHLFEPFVQGDRTLDRSAGGLGLGLALVKALVELHGGTVSVESEGEGRGASFVVRLPLEVERPVPAPALPERIGAARRVLLIEDSGDAAQSLREALELNDHVVEIAHSGLEGLAKARAFRPDVVLCDIGLPGMDGYAVARAMRADPELRRISLVALSGYALPEDRERAREAGFDEHLAKPADVAGIERTMARVRGDAT